MRYEIDDYEEGGGVEDDVMIRKKKERFVGYIID